MQTDLESNGDSRYFLRPDEPIITPERAAKGDIRVDIPCDSCEGKGARDGRRCRECHGSGKIRDTRWDSGELPLNEIRFAQLQCATVMNALEQRGVLGTQHVHDGQTYEIWQTIFRARQGYRNNPIYADEMARMTDLIVEDELPVEGFVRTIRQLGAERCRIVEYAIYTSVTPHVSWLLERSTRHYRPAFDLLSSVMERLREDCRNSQEENG